MLARLAAIEALLPILSASLLLLLLLLPPGDVTLTAQVMAPGGSAGPAHVRLGAQGARAGVEE